VAHALLGTLAMVASLSRPLSGALPDDAPRTRPAWLRAALASRLMHFLVLGGAIFALAPRPPDTRRVSVSGVGVAALEHAEAMRRGVPSLTPEAAQEVRARTIEDELLYREALRLGLDRDDPIIRQRLGQKLLLLVEDLGGGSRAPTDDELRAFFDADPSRWRLPASYRIVHVFATRAEALPPDDALVGAGVPAAGEPFPYSRDVTLSREDLSSVYGPSFAEAVVSMAPGDRYSPPIASRFGWHRVRMVERKEGRIPRFAEVKQSIELDYVLARRERIVGAYLEKTAREYSIDVDGKPLVGFVPTRRVAVRSDPSAED